MDTLTYSAMAVIASDNEDRNTVTMFSKKNSPKMKLIFKY